MIVNCSFSAPYALLLIEGSENSVIPERMDGALFVATTSCLAIGCRAEDDGPTSLELGPIDELETEGHPDFMGSLKVPQRLLAVRTVLGETKAQLATDRELVTLSVWVDDLVEPAAIKVGIQ